MVFSIQTMFYKLWVRCIGLLLKVVPQPRPIVFCGPDSSHQLTRNIVSFGYRHVLVVTDTVINKMGLIDDVQSQLLSAGVQVTFYDGVEPNPSFSHIDAGLKLVKEFRCDAILAFGGGSPIDVAKVISVAATNKRAPEELVGFFRVDSPGLPLFAIPTTAGTGSEVSVGAVISDSVSHKKSLIADGKTVPVAVALDPNVMLGLPSDITAATGMDALTHAVEAYISTLATPESDIYAQNAIKIIFKSLPEVYQQGANVEARESMALASYYAALAFNKALLGYVHGVAHQFGRYYNTPHGLANAIVLPHILEFNQDVCAERLAQLALSLGLGKEGESNVELASAFVSAVRNLNITLNIPSTLEALREQDISSIAKIALRETHLACSVPKYMGQKQCELLLRNMRA